MTEAYWHGLAGGMVIGVAAVLLYWLNGRIMGVSGMAYRSLEKPGKDTVGRLAFLAGLAAGGAVWTTFWPVAVVVHAGWILLLVAGVLVGFGTAIGGGCTSGHGICGIARFSPRSIAATLMFMATGIVTVWLKGRMGW